MKTIIQWILAVAVLSALLVWGPRAYAAEPAYSVGEIITTPIVCNEQSLRLIIKATTEGRAEAQAVIQGAAISGGCAPGPYMVKIVARSYQWEDFEGDIFQVWEIQPVYNVPPPYRTFTWEHIGGPNHPSNLRQEPTSSRFGQSRSQSI